MSEARPTLQGEGLAQPRELRLELPSTHDSVRIARSMLRHFARLEGVGDAEVDRLLLVSSELLANAVDHGGGNAALTDSQLLRRAHMGLRIELRGHGWTLEVTDQGGGDPTEVRRRLVADGQPAELDERGRGMYLIDKLVDRVEVERTGDRRGLVVRVVRSDVRVG